MRPTILITLCVLLATCDGKPIVEEAKQIEAKDAKADDKKAPEAKASEAKDEKAKADG